MAGPICLVVDPTQGSPLFKSIYPHKKIRLCPFFAIVHCIPPTSFRRVPTGGRHATFPTPSLVRAGVHMSRCIVRESPNNALQHQHYCNGSNHLILHVPWYVNGIVDNINNLTTKTHARAPHSNKCSKQRCCNYFIKATSIFLLAPFACSIDLGVRKNRGTTMIWISPCASLIIVVACSKKALHLILQSQNSCS